MDKHIIQPCNLEAFTNTILDKAKHQVPADNMAKFTQFTSLFLHRYTLDDAEGRQWSDVIGQIYYLWQCIQEPLAGTALVSLIQPNQDEHGWQSRYHSLIVRQADMPFLVDSIRIELSRRNIAIKSIKSTSFVAKRGELGVESVLPLVDKNSDSEVLLYLEIDLRPATDDKNIVESLLDILDVIRRVVKSYPELSARIIEASNQLDPILSSDNFVGVAQSQKFLRWLAGNHFTFLGYSEFDFKDENGVRVLVENTDKRLGLFDDESEYKTTKLDGTFDGVENFHISKNVVDFSKSPMRSRVHRNAYSDYVVVKKVDADGRIIGELRFLGLYTSAAYAALPNDIPLLQDKLKEIYKRVGINVWSHEGKELQQIISTFPRDELFQSNVEELYDVLTGILNIHERHKVRLFARRDRFGRFVSCLVFMPRDLLTTQLREKIQNIISSEIKAVDHEHTTFYSESVLVRVHIVFRLNRESPSSIDIECLQKKITDITRSWDGRLFDALVTHFDEDQAGTLAAPLRGAFSQAYQEYYSPSEAVLDVKALQQLVNSDIAMRFTSADGVFFRFKIFHKNIPLELSEVIPILENMGFRVISEYPFEINTASLGSVWLHDFKLQKSIKSVTDINDIKDSFTSAFVAIWKGQADNDVFNRLVISASLDWREVEVLRSYANYMHQILFNFSSDFITQALVNQAAITQQLIQYFTEKFAPGDKSVKARLETLGDIKAEVITALDSVNDLSEDRILRYYLNLIDGTLRCNYYQQHADGNHKPYISFKLSPRDIDGIPEPRPLFEIYVSSPRFEGVHLRGGKVARGGLRWSDRLQDYRTEVLGLVKAQQVKNAVIVPNGAKGGFVCKRALGMNRDEFQAEGIACYQNFISGLLDVTDNLEDGNIVPPKQVVRFDADDPYLVVAADKGTATFSDIANAISVDYGHWLGDAFASGGSEGYDHKQMGITARGAWVSVQRHFKEVGVNVQTEPFTVVAIGDMSGDVFGNGMLLSEKIQLTAAFNHLHIFIDPTPDFEKNFAERKRLFALPRSNWGDYDESLISAGGGIFSRQLKSIKITPEMKQCFAIEENALTPTELINRLLKSPSDLIWNGGIGTYVKSSDETHADVGDKANDVLRVDARDLRCKVFGEGGNLGITQRARIEFAQNGGACNSDFIDNAAGVDCSDHEVNIKILLGEQVKLGLLTTEDRNDFLREMTEAVADRVLTNNYQQTQAISVAQSEAASRLTEHQRLIVSLETAGRLNRTLEFLPSDEQIADRRAIGNGLTRPELSILISYAKVTLKEDLAVPGISEDTYIASIIERAFPKEMMSRYPKELYQHRLRTEIIATQLANDLVNTMGCTFVHRLQDAAGVDAPTVARAYIVARDIQDLHADYRAVEALDFAVPAHLQLTLIKQLVRRVRRTTRWFLRNHRSGLDVANKVNQYKDCLATIQGNFSQLLRGCALERWQAEVESLTADGVGQALAERVASPGYLYSGLSIIEVATQCNKNVLDVAPLYFYLIDFLGLDGFATQISEARVENYWEAMAREAYMDDLDSQVRRLVESLLGLISEGQSIESVMESWAAQHELLVTRWNAMVTQLQLSSGSDFAMFSVALRELLDLVQVSRHIGLDT